MDQYLYENYVARQEEKIRKEKDIQEYIKYLKTRILKILEWEKMSYDEIKRLFLEEKASDPDSSIEEVIGIDRSYTTDEGISEGIITALSNFADLFVPDITDVALEGMNPIIGKIYKALSFLGQEVVDIGRTVIDSSDLAIDYKNLPAQDSGFRLFSEYEKIYSMLPESFRDRYDILASQNSMLMAMSQNPEEANSARVQWDSLMANIKNMMASDENYYLKLRYKDFQEESSWISSDFLNQMYKMKDDFYPSMARYLSGIASGVMDPSFLKYFNDQEYNSVQTFPKANSFNSSATDGTTSYEQPFRIYSPLNIKIEVKGKPGNIDTSDNIEQDFVSPEERRHMPAAEEMEKIKSLQQIPIMINNSAESMSKIKSNTKDAKDNTFVLSHTLSDVARYAGQIGGAFMGVNEEIGKAIGSAGTLTEGVAGIFKAFEGDKVNGLGLMSGIQGGFAGLQGLFGGEPGSDMSELLGGLGGVGAGIAGLLTGRASGSFQFRLANT